MADVAGEHGVPVVGQLALEHAGAEAVARGRHPSPLRSSGSRRRRRRSSRQPSISAFQPAGRGELEHLEALHRSATASSTSSRGPSSRPAPARAAPRPRRGRRSRRAWPRRARSRRGGRSRRSRARSVSPSSSTRSPSTRAAQASGASQVVSPAAQTQPWSCSTCASVSSGSSRLPAQVRRGDPRGRVRELHRLHVVRVDRRRLVLPDERPRLVQRADREPGLALDVVRVERRVEDAAEDRVVPLRGLPGGRDREHLRRRRAPPPDVSAA